MKQVALVCIAAAVAIAHSATSPNIYEAVIKEQEDEREAVQAKEHRAKQVMDQVLAGEKIVARDYGIAALSKSSQVAKVYKPLNVKDAPMSAAWQEMGGLVEDMEMDAKNGKVDPAIQAARVSEKSQPAALHQDNTGVEYKVYEAETTIGESESKRRAIESAPIPAVAPGQSWGNIVAQEKQSEKTLLDPETRVGNWANDMSNDLAKAKPVFLQNTPKKKGLVAVNKTVHVNDAKHVNTGGSTVWPNVMPSMQVSSEEPVKELPAKQVASRQASASSAQSKAMHAEAVRALNEFHNDPMYQHLLGPSEDPELSAQTQQDLKLLHAALGKSDPLPQQHRPVAKPSSRQAAVTKPAVAKPAVAKPVVERLVPKPVAHEAVPAAPKPVAQKQVAPAPKPSAPNPVAPKRVDQRYEAKRPVRKVALPNHPQPAATKPRPPAPQAQHARPPAHAPPQPAVAKHAPPQPAVDLNSPLPPQVLHAPQVPQHHPAPAAFRRPQPAKVPAQKAAQPKYVPKPRGAKLWSSDMDPTKDKDSSREDSLEARVAEQAAETRAEMEKETTATDEEFPVAVVPAHPAHHAFSHVTSGKKAKVGVPEGSGTKTVDIEGLPNQGYNEATGYGEDVSHEDGKSMTKDWGTEYGAIHNHAESVKASPPAKSGAAAWTAPCFALALLILN